MKRVFGVTKQEFAGAVGPLRRQIHLMLWVVFPILAVLLAGGVLLTLREQAVAGGVLAIGSVGAILGLIRRVWTIGYDQVVLEVFPATYETLFALCQSSEQFELVFQAFLNDTVTMRRRLVP